MANVLIIGDLHLPAERADYLKYCRAMKRKHKTTKTVFIGDILDHHAISFHQKNPDSDGAVEEYTRLYVGGIRLFPKPLCVSAIMMREYIG